VARVDRLREVDDGAVALVVIASSVSRPSRPTARALDVAQAFGDAVQRDFGRGGAEVGFGLRALLGVHQQSAWRPSSVILVYVHAAHLRSVATRQP